MDSQSWAVLVGICMLLYTSPTGCHQLVVNPAEDQVKALHSSVILCCSVIDFDPAEGNNNDLDLCWIGPDTRRIQDKHGRVHVERIDGDTVNLYITKLEESDAGVYSCQLNVNSQPIQPITKSIQLSIFENIRFEDRPISYQFKVGERNALLQCSAIGMPIPEISWRFNKTKLPKASEKYIYEKEGLIINDVTVGDRGTYECRAQVESQGSLKIRHITLDVLYPPVITEHPHVLEQVIKGQDAVLNCSAEGNPPVRYEWFLEKRVSDLVKAKVLVQKGGQSLRIREVDTGDEGRYFCRVSNSVGMRESAVDITMLVPPSVKDLGTRVTVEGRTLILPCELINGRPSPELFWSSLITGHRFTEGTQLDDDSISVDSTHRGVSKLIIRNIQRSHSGEYLCQAINAVGSSTRIAVINVEYVPRINMSASEVFGWSGQVRNLTCIADGHPLPVVTWLSRGQHIFDTPSHKVETTRTNKTATSTLKITIDNQQPWIFGNYSCVAKNLHGSASMTFHLREAVAPDGPHNVSVVDVRDTEATLLVTSPKKTGGIQMTSWMIKYEPVEKDAKEKTIFFDPDPGNNLTTMTLTHLLPDTEYTFYLAAGNDVGFGEPIKFLVKTDAKSVQRTQHDVPQKSHPGKQENVWKDPAALGKAMSSGNGSEDGKSSVGIILGVIGALAILVLVSAGIAFWVRRQRSRGRFKNFPIFRRNDPSDKKGKVQDHSNEEDGSDKIIQMAEVRSPNDEVLCPGDDPLGEEGVPMRSPKFIANGNSFFTKVDRNSNPPTPVRSLTVTPSSVHKFAWDHGFQTREFHDEDLSSGFGTAEPDLSVQSDIPPPPEFIYDQNGIRVSVNPRDPDEDSIPDNLDGVYQSEDNMDEDELEELYGDRL